MGLLQLAPARLLRLEQPSVLDSDDGLIGENLEQLDLSVNERSHLSASYHYRTDGLTGPYQRNCNDEKRPPYRAIRRGSQRICSGRYTYLPASPATTNPRD